jgi:hypothetical protein
MENKRVVNRKLEKLKVDFEEIPGFIISIIKIPDPRYRDREYMVMSTGIVYFRYSYYSNSLKNQRWRYVHEDPILKTLTNKTPHEIETLKIRVNNCIKEHLDIYCKLMNKPDTNYLLIKKSVNNFMNEMFRLYSKVGLGYYISRSEFEPWAKF